MNEGGAESSGGGKNSITIADRMRMAEGSVKGVTKSDVAREIARLAKEQDAAGIRDLYKAYSDWETRGNGFRGEELRRVTPRSPDVLQEDINRNLDTTAALADALIENNGDEYLAFRAIADGSGLNTLGPVRRYYRETVGYEPALTIIEPAHTVLIPAPANPLK